MASTDLNGECKVDVIVSDNPRNRARLRKEGKNMKSRIGSSFQQIWKLLKEDPRRLIHSMKCGAALSLVSLLYLIDPLFNGVGDNAIWAVLTVVVVLEFTAGATLSKGLNRGLGTLVAGSLATCVSYFSEHAGVLGEAIIIGFSVFVLGAAASFTRFFPTIKRRYDYGVVTFLLTFNLIAVSGYRVDNIFRMTYERLSTIGIGCSVCLVISLLVCPIWAGEDLHNSTADKLDGLAQSLEGCVREYFDERAEETDEDDGIDTPAEDGICEGYKSVLDSKVTDESLATFAGWEPRHGRFRYRHPWKLYVKIGANLRHLAYSIVALHGCLRSEIQTPLSVRWALKKPCLKLSEEATKILRELAYSVRHMQRCDTETMTEDLHLALKDLQAALQGLPRHLMDLRRWHSDKIQGFEVQVYDQGNSISTTKKKVLYSSASLVESNTERSLRRPMLRRELQSLVRTQSHASTQEKVSTEYGEELPLVTFAWLVVESVMRVEHVVEAAVELATRAQFKPYIPSHARPKKSLVKVFSAEIRRSGVLESHATSQSVD